MIYAAVVWAIAYRVNAGENALVIMPSTFGAGLDPSTRKPRPRHRAVPAAEMERMLIDATIIWTMTPTRISGGARFPPTVCLHPRMSKPVRARWKELA